MLTMKCNHTCILVSIVLWLVGCAVPVNQSLQNYDNVIAEPAKNLMPPPELKDFESLPSGVKFKSSVDEYDASLKSYEQYIKRNHEKLNTKAELRAELKKAESSTTVEEESVDVQEYEKLGIRRPNCSDKYFTTPDLPSMPTPKARTANMSTADIAAASLEYNEQLTKYIADGEQRIRISIALYNKVCKK